jgi:Tol biopolymer transport system component
VNYAGFWTRDGLRLVFASNRSGDWDLYTQPADGSRPAEALLRRPSNQWPSSISADGTVIFYEMDPATGYDLWTLSPDGKTAPLRVTPFNESDGQVSPDGRWVAYASDESGQSEIYVQSYPAGASRAPVSSSGGRMPRWSRDGRELFYIHGNALVAVPVRADGAIGAPRRLFDTSNYWFGLGMGYQVSPDGQRFLMIRPDLGAEPRQLNVILNWADHSAWPSRAATR